MSVKVKNLKAIVEEENIPFDFDPNSDGAQKKLTLANSVGLGDIRKEGSARKLHVVVNDEPLSYSKRIRIAAHKRATGVSKGISRAASSKAGASKFAAKGRSAGTASNKGSTADARINKGLGSSKSSAMKGRSSNSRNLKK